MPQLLYRPHLHSNHHNRHTLCLPKQVRNKYKRIGIQTTQSLQQSLQIPLLQYWLFLMRQSLESLHHRLHSMLYWPHRMTQKTQMQPNHPILCCPHHYNQPPHLHLHR
jgi:hypothetical protein